MVKHKGKNRKETVAKKQITVYNMLLALVPVSGELQRVNTYWNDTKINSQFSLSMIWNSCAFFIKDVKRFAGSDYEIVSAQKKGTFVRKI